jgi:tRNA nucleotidyltransferase (CCA-adding enzyme)
LKEFDAAALCVLWVAADDAQVRERVELYHRELQCVEPALDGHYLQELGVKPGPIYRDILGAVHNARLDREVTSKAEEEALVARILDEAS